MTALPGLQRSARHQLGPDATMLDHLGGRAWQEETGRPNLFLLTGPTHPCAADCPIPDDEHAMLLPVLELRAG